MVPHAAGAGQCDERSSRTDAVELASVGPSGMQGWLSGIMFVFRSFLQPVCQREKSLPT